MRGSTRRTWVKLFVIGWLHGSVRWQLTPEERGTFADLLAFAGECGRDGEISDNDGRAFPFSFIANQLNIPLELLERTIAKCVTEGRIKLGEPVEQFEGNETNEGVIHIVNWTSYQSEYERQKPYRGKQDDPDKYTRQKYSEVINSGKAILLRQKKKELGRDLTLEEEQGILGTVPGEEE